ncbi:hypothetical protein [uncultured Tateyamaria sp.]|uniref:hypothetical protein n=1 Tax=uncultured Tateyamaria sp. TaxID=455651 RepID=UPI00260D6FEC|nr:hypothetical protein [uncultured Tateyamaria sp.]
MSNLAKTFTACILTLGMAAPALSDTARTVKFESRYGKKIKGAVCQVTVGNQRYEVVTPARVKLPLDVNGRLNIAQMDCDLQGIRKTTSFFPAEDVFDREIYGITVSFKDEKTPFSYLKKNGGLAVWKTRDGNWVPVR